MGWWRTQAQTRRGPAHGPRPTSSIPRIATCFLFFGFAGTFGILFFFDGFWVGFFGGEDFFDFFGCGEVVDSVAVKIFADEAGGLAGAVTQVAQVVAADFATTNDFDFFN